MNAAVYLRVSTEKQDEKNQEPDCLRVCAARGWEPMVVREKESGAKKRTAWDSVKDSARVGAVGAVVVWSLDRMGRRMFELVADVRELDRLGVQVVSVKEPWLDTGGPARDLLLSIFAWVAQHERERLRERTNAGLARARAAGKTLGRRRAEISPAVLDRAITLKADRGWHTVAARIEAEFGERYDPATLRRAFLRACEKGGGNGI